MIEAAGRRECRGDLRHGETKRAGHDYAQGQPRPSAAPPAPEVAWASELTAPARMQMIEKEIASSWRNDSRRRESSARTPCRAASGRHHQRAPCRILARTHRPIPLRLLARIDAARPASRASPYGSCPPRAVLQPEPVPQFAGQPPAYRQALVDVPQDDVILALRIAFDRSQSIDADQRIAMHTHKLRAELFLERAQRILDQVAPVFVPDRGVLLIGREIVDVRYRNQSHLVASPAATWLRAECCGSPAARLASCRRPGARRCSAAPALGAPGLSRVTHGLRVKGVHGVES